MKIKYISRSQSASTRQKFIALVVGLALLALLLMFAVMLLPIALLGIAYLWWKTRAVRKQFRQMQAKMRQMQDFPAQARRTQGEVFEGEIIREYKSDLRSER